jgi:hypothetical protein
MENWRRVAGGCVRDVFSALGVAFETFTLADLVANPLVREPLEHALNLENMDYALALAAYGFYRLRGMYEEIAGPAIGLEMWVLGESRVADMLQTVKCADGKDDSVTAALSAMTHLGMGLDLDEYARFRWLTAGRIGLFDGDWKVSLEEEKFKVRVVTANDVLWVVDYVARQAVRLERNHAALRTFTEASIERDPRRMRDLKFLPVRFRQLGAG